MNQGEAAARRELAGLYLFGKGVPENRELALELLRLAADSGDRDAKMTQARLYGGGLAGYPTEEDVTKALDLYLELAESGDAEAQFELVAEKNLPGRPLLFGANRALFAN